MKNFTFGNEYQPSPRLIIIFLKVTFFTITPSQECNIYIINIYKLFKYLGIMDETISIISETIFL